MCMFKNNLKFTYLFLFIYVLLIDEDIIDDYRES